MCMVYRILGLLCLFAVLPASSQGADRELRQAARSVLKKYQSVLVMVKLTVMQPAKVTDNTERDGGKETAVALKVDVPGTVLSPDGLIVVSNSSIGSRVSMDDLLAASFGSLLAGLSGSPKAKTNEETLKKTDKEANKKDTGKIKQVTIRFQNRPAMPGRVVGVDKKNDLTFVRPVKSLSNLPCLVPDGAAQLDVLDDVIVLYPLSKAFKNRIAVSRLQIAAAADTKGSVAVLDTVTEALLGCPVFDSGGRPIGIVSLPASREAPTIEQADNETTEAVILGEAQLREARSRVGKK